MKILLRYRSAQKEHNRISIRKGLNILFYFFLDETLNLTKLNKIV